MSSFTIRSSNLPGPRASRVSCTAFVLLAWQVGLGLGIAAQQAKPHWAFQPVRSPTPPPVKLQQLVLSPIDQFIVAKLEARGLTLSAQAAPRTLLRRATYDLTGLPPAAQDVDALAADPGAFANAVERLLNSPHYGEQWGRHWLDVVRYADTAGENTDHPLPHAWRYRNWVIEAFNQDKPYDEFIREQIAGDLLAAAGPSPRFAERVMATGYLAIARRFGHDIDKDIHLTFEDTIDTLGKSVLGLTLGCARCHDHKYDPVTTRDYYAFYGILASTRFPFPGCEPVQQPRDLIPLMPAEEIVALRKPFEAELAALDTAIGTITNQQAAARQHMKELVAHSRLLAQGQFDDGGSQSLSSSTAPLELVVQAGELVQLSIYPRGNYGADSTLVELEIAETTGAQRRWNLTQDVIEDFLASNPHADRQGNAGVWCFLDARDGLSFMAERLPDHEGNKGLNIWRQGDTPSAWVNATDQPLKVWTTLPPRTFFVHPAPDGPAAVAWLSPVSGPVRVQGRVADAHPGGGDGVSWRLEYVAGHLAPSLGEMKALAERLGEPLRRRTELKAREPKVDVAYAVADGAPHNARLHQRGDPERLGHEVPRKFLDVLGGQPLIATNTSGRLELAQWLTSPTNPLTARVMVNRIWQGHFGHGLVSTPNDFGLRGQPPTNPELLDWLARQFIDSGWSVKHLHRLIMTSATYQQCSSGLGAEVMNTATLNDYATFPRRRLTAEELRDTLLVVSGELDRSPGGPHPFPPEDKWSFTQHGPFAADYDTLKRSVYVMQKRNRRSPYFALFDGADPNASTAVRDVTTVPTQALYFMNDPFVHARAAKFAARIVSAASEDPARLDFAYRELFAQRPDAEEQATATEFLHDYSAACGDMPTAERAALAWSAYARVLLASNKLLYLE